MKLRDLLYSTEERVNNHFVALNRPLRSDLTRILTRYEENYSWEELQSLFQAADLDQDISGLSDDGVRELLEPLKVFLRSAGSVSNRIPNWAIRIIMINLSRSPVKHWQPN